MSRRSMTLGSLALAALFCAPASAVSADDFAFFHENVMGTSLELRVRAESPEAARSAEDRVLGEIDRLVAVFSGWDRTTEFHRWQAVRSGPIPVSRELFTVLQASDRWRERSGGAFDVRAQAFTRLWSQTAKEGRVPSSEEQAAANLLAARPAWRLDPRAGTAERLSNGPLSLDGIAKGYIVGRACEAGFLRERGILGLLLNVGGDLCVRGEPARTLGIAAPRGDSESTEPFVYIAVKDRAVSTSGDSQRGLWIGGRWYSHIFDPRTGAPAAGIASATVIAESSLDADALATALNVLPPVEGLRLVESLPGADALIVDANGRTYRSEGWSRYERPRPEPAGQQAGAKPDGAVALANADASWGDAFELRVDFEINRPQAEGGRYRRPYVAIWVEDKNGFPVRNLALWVSQGGAGPFQWVPDLKRWYKADQERKKVDRRDMVLTISRPTRPPGKYSVVWDGKDDFGKPLPRGEYTILLDAAREHGTYQGLQKSVTLAETPFAEDLNGNVEIKSARIEYRRKALGK